MTTSRSHSDFYCSYLLEGLAVYSVRQLIRINHFLVGCVIYFVIPSNHNGLKGIASPNAAQWTAELYEQTVTGKREENKQKKKKAHKEIFRLLEIVGIQDQRVIMSNLVGHTERLNALETSLYIHEHERHYCGKTNHNRFAFGWQTKPNCYLQWPEDTWKREDIHNRSKMIWCLFWTELKLFEDVFEHQLEKIGNNWLSLARHQYIVWV